MLLFMNIAIIQFITFLSKFSTFISTISVVVIATKSFTAFCYVQKI